MDITSQFIIGRLYMDAFGVNCAIGSSSNKHKILGIYISFFSDLRMASKRNTVQCVALIFPLDIEKFGLHKCLKKVISDLKLLVNEGLKDMRSNKTYQFRVVANLGDNLEQNELAGLLKNFSTMKHACRHCLCSRDDLESANYYEDISARYYNSGIITNHLICIPLYLALLKTEQVDHFFYIAETNKKS